MILRYTNLLFWIGAFFPYVQLLPTNTDVQPTVLLIAFLFFIVYTYCYGIKRLNFLEMVPILACFYLLIISIISSTFELRAFAGLMSIAVIIFTMRRLIWIDHTIAWLLEAAVYVYLIFGVVQLFIPMFGSFLVMRITTTLDRGVTSIAPEPSYYGIMCFFLFCMIRLFTQLKFFKVKNSWWLQALLVFQCLFLAKSFWGFLAFTLFLVVYMLYAMNLRKILIGSLLISAGLLFLALIPNDLRMIVMINKLLHNPELLLLDASANSRFYNIVIPVDSIFDGFRGIFGHGLGAWPGYFALALSKYHNYFWVESSAKIMSGFGEMIFDMGILGIFYSLWLCLGHLQFKNKELMVQSIVVFCLMFGAIPLTYPLFTIWVYLAFNSKRINENNIVGV